LGEDHRRHERGLFAHHRKERAVGVEQPDHVQAGPLRKDVQIELGAAALGREDVGAEARNGGSKSRREDDHVYFRRRAVDERHALPVHLAHVGYGADIAMREIVQQLRIHDGMGFQYLVVGLG